MMSQQKKINNVLLYTFLMLFTIVMLFPFLIMLSTSLKGEDEIYMQETFSFLPKSWKFSNFIDTLKVANWDRYFFNSLYMVISDIFCVRANVLSFGKVPVIPHEPGREDRF